MDNLKIGDKIKVKARVWSGYEKDRVMGVAYKTPGALIVLGNNARCIWRFVYPDKEVEGIFIGWTWLLYGKRYVDQDEYGYNEPEFYESGRVKCARWVYANSPSQRYRKSKTSLPEDIKNG